MGQIRRRQLAGPKRASKEGRRKQPPSVRAPGLLLVVALVGMSALLFSSARLQPVGANSGIIYVDDSATGANTGLSWNDAFTDLQGGLALAVAGDEIWVAAGKYRPDALDRNMSFVLKNEVAVYGGFAGSENLRSERDWHANESLLSGDLLNDDGPLFASISDNSEHVVFADFGVDTTAVLDGFTISAGNSTVGSGGGMYLKFAGPTISHVVYRANHSVTGAGGMFHWAQLEPNPCCPTFSLSTI